MRSFANGSHTLRAGLGKIKFHFRPPENTELKMAKNGLYLKTVQDIDTISLAKMWQMLWGMVLQTYHSLPAAGKSEKSGKTGKNG